MNHRPESKSYNYKTFRENIGVNFCDFGLNNGFLNINITPKEQVKK